MRLKTGFVLPVALLCLMAAPAHGADLVDTPVNGPVPPADEMRQALTERAILYDLRVAFDVMDEADVEPALTADARKLKSTGFFEEQRSFTEQDLLAEGSYYIVSLSYIVQAGGADWPTDRAASIYEKDATVKLEALKQHWIAALGAGEADDLLGIMRDTDTINAWTEGETATTSDLAKFDNVEALVTQALADAG